MITEALWNAWNAVALWALSLLPTGDPPDFIATTSRALGLVIQSVSGLAAWVPWGFALGCITVSLGLWLSVLVVKAVRWLVGWLPTMGGA